MTGSWVKWIAPAEDGHHPASGEAEWSGRALGAGALLGALLAAGNVYVGLKVSFVDSGSITAALLAFSAFAALRRVGGRSFSPLENNLSTTVASSAAVMASATGLLGPVAALALMGRSYPAWAIALWGAALSAVGIHLAARLRPRLILAEGLRFPSGTATAEVIRTVHARGGGRTRALLASAAGSMLVTWLRDGKPALLPATVSWPGSLGGVPANALGVGLNASPLLVATGGLVGLPNALALVAGGVTAWLVLAPRMIARGEIAGSGYAEVVSWLLWPGVALMVSSALTALGLEWRTFVDALRDLRRAGSDGASGEEGRLSRALAMAGVVVVLGLGWRVFGVSPVYGAGALLLSVVLSAVCARAAGETDMAPVGAMGGATQIVAGLVAPGRPVVSLVGGSIVNANAQQATQMLWSFKQGQALSATPRRQVLAQLLGALVGAAVVVPVYSLIVKAHGLGTDAMPASAVLSWKATAELVSRGTAAMPGSAAVAAAVAAGLGIAATLGRRARWGRHLPSPIAVGTAFLIPLSYALTILVGAAAVHAVQRRRPGWAEDHLAGICAGGMAGEALMGLLVAALVAAGVL